MTHQILIKHEIRFIVYCNRAYIDTDVTHAMIGNPNSY